MKNFFKYFGISAILIFSFYYTERINDVVITNSDLFNEIKSISSEYVIAPINATIDGAYIIPGVMGKSVDVFDSYYNMKDFQFFNETYLSYINVPPEVSISNNKDKIIKKGNSHKRNIAIILKDNQKLIDYSYSKDIKFSRLVSINTYDNNYNYEQINNETEYFNKLEILLNKKHNTNICVIDNNESICRDNKKYLVESTIKLNNYNISEIKSYVDNGSIIYVNDDVSLADYKVLLSQINYNDLQMVWLSTLINEERD